MKICFIGIGNMGYAILKGYLQESSGKDVNIFDTDSEKIKKYESELGVKAFSCLKEAVKDRDIILLCVKPNVVSTVLNEIKDEINENTLLISIAAGIKLSFIEEVVGKNKKIVRVMPNVNLLVSEGMCGICKNENVNDDELSNALEIFKNSAECEVVKEELMDTVTGLSGSAPAFVFMFIEALANAGVKLGLSSDMALKFASQTVYGSAKTLKETKLHPAILKEMVSSPGGTTIEGVEILEKRSFRSAVMEAVEAAAEKSNKLGK